MANYPLTLVLILLAFTSETLTYIRDRLSPIFPPAENAKSAAFYTLADHAYLLGAVVLILLFFVMRGRPRREQASSLALLGLAYLSGSFWFLFALPSLWRPRVESPSTSNVLPTVDHWLFFALVLFLGATTYMCLSVNIAYDIAWREVVHMIGLSGVVTAGLYLLVAGLGTVASRRWLVTYAVCVVAFSLLSYAYFSHLMASLLSQFDFSRLPALSSGIVTAALLLVVSPTTLNGTPRTQHYLHLFYGSIQKRQLWFKVVLFGVVVRLTFGYLNDVEADIGTEMLLHVYDSALALTTFLLIGAVVHRALPHFKFHPRFKIALVIALIAGVFAPIVAYSNSSWTVHIESYRRFAVRISSTARDLLGYVGVSDDRPARRKIKILEELIAEGSTKAPSQSLTEPPGVAPASKSPAPHVFLFITDATTRLRMGSYGYHRQNTPHLEEFAKDAVKFSNYFSVSSDTFQNMTAIFSGQYVGRHPDLDKTDKSRICQILKPFQYKFFVPDFIAQFGLRVKHCARATRLSYTGMEAKDWQKIAESLKSNPSPHFVYIHVHGGHNPWSVPDDYLTYGSQGPDIYDSLIRMADEQFGTFVARLKEMNLYDKSLVIFTSDHGIGLGDHLDMSSYTNLYSNNVNIPMLIKLSGHIDAPPTPRTIDNYYSHLDFLPSLASFLGTAVEPPLPGNSWLPELLEPAPAQERCLFATAAYTDSFSMQCSNGNKIIWFRALGTLNVYNSLTDPLERQNLVDQVDETEFREMARPFADFLAAGANSYARR